MAETVLCVHHARPFPGHTGGFHFPGTLAFKSGSIRLGFNQWMASKSDISHLQARPLQTSRDFLQASSCHGDLFISDWIDEKWLSDLCGTFFFLLVRNKHLLCYTTEIMVVYLLLASIA